MAKLKFLTSAVKIEQYPKAFLPEIAIVGRSNAGKSSLINAVYQHKIAKVSATPGKTRTLNFFSVNSKYHLVDMPGYGFAVGDAGEVDSWQSMIEEYLSTRGGLQALVLVMDIRREWQREEEVLKKWLAQISKPMVLVLNKSDKLSKNQATSKKVKLKKSSGVEHIFVTSCSKKQGLIELEEFLFQNFVKTFQS